ncbi:hypothetical protein CWI37_0030p0030 [Hamiltosporidium tvaerminnensis]|uniref:Macro domain-containing protein n=1 Tax=Hamiltosporidium tvaerminnensis TaxID=1176355 RepID=A0A4Q9LEJ3_9MICR|nr:hypothetical protein CWI37_0030p0030 [Hamiltosporidium tvaerminnensis]
MIIAVILIIGSLGLIQFIRTRSKDGSSSNDKKNTAKENEKKSDNTKKQMKTHEINVEEENPLPEEKNVPPKEEEKKQEEEKQEEKKQEEKKEEVKQEEKKQEEEKQEEKKQEEEITQEKLDKQFDLVNQFRGMFLSNISLPTLKTEFKAMIVNTLGLRVSNIKMNSKLKYKDLIKAFNLGLDKICIVNAANESYHIDGDGLNAGLTEFAKSNGGLNLEKNQWKNLTDKDNKPVRVPVLSGSYAISDFNNGIIIHGVGPKACEVGKTPKEPKNLLEVKHRITDLYNNIYIEALKRGSALIIFPKISGDIYANPGEDQSFTKTTYLNAVYSGIIDFLKKIKVEGRKILVFNNI